jgi:hypothetical protein
MPTLPVYFFQLKYYSKMDKKPSTSFFEKTYNPILQGSAILLVAVLAMLIAFFLKWTKSVDVAGQAYWIIAGAAVLFYALFNSIFSLSSTDMNLYWTRAIPTFVGLMVLSAAAAYLFSAMTMAEAGSFRFIFIVLTFGYLLFLSIMRAMRKIVQLAQKEDDRWTKRMK